MSNRHGDGSDDREMISAMNYRERIVRDPRIVGGEPVLKAQEDVRAAIPFAAASAQAGFAAGRNADQALKIKLDENLPCRLVSVLTALGHDIAHFPVSGNPCGAVIGGARFVTLIASGRSSHGSD